jgi:molybdopterin-guanine dinucleotide biosynthesis protein
MTEVIAFSGVHNTGKSFALEKIRTQCEQEGQLIFVMKETARMLLPLLGVDQARMQQGMNRIELERIQYLQKLKDL